MQEPLDTPAQNSEPSVDRPVAHLELKARLLMLFTVLLMAGAAMYVLYARGAFEATQTLILTTDDSEGVVAGMDMTFSGFPIGRVRRVELARDGNVRILIDVASKDAHWLRTSSVFTLVRGIVGGTAIRAFTGVLTDPLLPDEAERPVLRGDATAEIPRVIAAAKDLLENLNNITTGDSELRNTLANLRVMTAKLNGPQGALGVLFGNDADSRKLMTALDRANTVLARLDTLAARVDGLAAKTDTQVFGPEGVMKEAQTTVKQLNGLLAETRTSLKKVDAVLVEAQGISTDVRGATADLGALRSDVEANLRKVEGLINDINRKWPFARDTQIKVP